MQDSLQRIVLAANNIEAIPPRETSQAALDLKHISLSFNRIKTWRDIDALPSWCPHLESLALTGNPLVNGRHATLPFNTAQLTQREADPELGKNARQLAIAKIPTLTVLDAALASALFVYHTHL